MSDDYKVMTFKCTGCNHIFKLWNSRKAPAPASVYCTECGEIAYRIDRHRDQCMLEYEPQKSDLVAVNWGFNELLQITQRKAVRALKMGVDEAARYAADTVTGQFEAENKQPVRVLSCSEWLKWRKSDHT